MSIAKEALYNQALFYCHAGYKMLDFGYRVLIDKDFVSTYFKNKASDILKASDKFQKPLYKALEENGQSEQFDEDFCNYAYQIFIEADKQQQKKRETRRRFISAPVMMSLKFKRTKKANGIKSV